MSLQGHLKLSQDLWDLKSSIWDTLLISELVLEVKLEQNKDFRELITYSGIVSKNGISRVNQGQG